MGCLPPRGPCIRRSVMSLLCSRRAMMSLACGRYVRLSLWYSCAPCPEGSHCPMRGDTATTCAAGFFSPLGVHLPLPTRAGWKAGGGVDIRPCEAGQTSDDFSDTCYTCQAGEVCSFPSNRRMVCNEGFYVTQWDFPNDYYKTHLFVLWHNVLC